LSAINKGRASREFHWADGGEVDAALWAPNEPNMFGQVDWACVGMMRDGKLAAYDCATKNRPLCQLPVEAAQCFL